MEQILSGIFKRCYILLLVLYFRNSSPSRPHRTPTPFSISPLIIFRVPVPTTSIIPISGIPMVSRIFIIFGTPVIPGGLPRICILPVIISTRLPFIARRMFDSVRISIKRFFIVGSLTGGFTCGRISTDSVCASGCCSRR